MIETFVPVVAALSIYAPSVEAQPTVKLEVQVLILPETEMKKRPRMTNLFLERATVMLQIKFCQELKVFDS